MRGMQLRERGRERYAQGNNKRGQTGRENSECSALSCAPALCGPVGVVSGQFDVDRPAPTPTVHRHAAQEARREEEIRRSGETCREREGEAGERQSRVLHV